MSSPQTAIIILHFGDLVTTFSSLESLSKKLTGEPIFLINNTSVELSTITKKFPKIKLINSSKNLGFAGGVNLGITQALSDPSIDSVLLWNNDLTFSHGNIEMLRRTLFSHPEFGAVTPVLNHAHGYDWGSKLSPWTGLVRHTNWENIPKTLQRVQSVAGACMLISRKAIEKVGLFDTRFFLYYEDVDYCLRLRHTGYNVAIDPSVVVYHAGSSGTRLWKRTLYQWKSHFLFCTKYMFKSSYPTAYLTDLVFYPIALLKSIITPK